MKVLEIIPEGIDYISIFYVKSNCQSRIRCEGFVVPFGFRLHRGIRRFQRFYAAWYHDEIQNIEFNQSVIDRHAGEQNRRGLFRLKYI